MNLLLILISFLTVLIALASLLLEIRRDLMMLQQNSYRNDRYIRWISMSGDSTSLRRLLGMAVTLGSLVIYIAPWAGIIMMAIFGVSTTVSLVRARYKKPLVMTNRATRIYTVAIALSAIVAIGISAWVFAGEQSIESSLFAAAVALSGLYCASHMVMIVANTVLQPVERRINRRYYLDAERIMKSMPDMKVIGITGSYGKTSTKHYLYTILSEQFETVMTPGSYNTTLGVVRTIREHLKPYTEVFIVEMGAKQRGDITEICDLVHPQIGIITAVGEQHLESFGSIDNIQATKFELVDALPPDGLAVINNDFAKIADREVTNVETIRYSVEGQNDTVAVTSRDIEVTPEGTSFVYEAGDVDSFSLDTSLIGRCNVSNLLAAVSVARFLGMSPDAIRRGVRRISQVEHRLSMKHTPGGLTIIDDAFNSNPVGAAMALEVLASLKTGRRIIITPGMIELGERQYAENRHLGELIGRSADIAILVGAYNRDAISEGISASGGTAKVHLADTFAQAQALMTSMARQGDTILYENDLPDTFK